MLFPKEFSENVNFEKKSVDDKKIMKKFPSMPRVNHASVEGVINSLVGGF